MLLVDYIERGHSINERYNGDKLTAGLHIRSLVGCVHGYGYQLADLPPYSADKLAYGYCKMELNCHHFLTDYDVIKAEGSLSHLCSKGVQYFSTIGSDGCVSLECDFVEI